MTAFDAAGRSETGADRARNEDAHLIHPTLPLWAVADGMGGLDAGAIASGTVVRCLCRARAVAEAEARIGLANRLLRDTARRRGRGPVGSTVVALTARGAAATLLWAGDSRAYRLRRGRLERLTTDHTAAQAMVTRGTLEPGAARGHPARHRLTRAVGIAETVTPARRSLELWRGDALLLCSDGLTGAMEDGDIALLLAEAAMGAGAAAICDTLMAAARERGARDDATALAVLVGDAQGR